MLKKKKCKVPGCSEEIASKKTKLCRIHYQRLYKFGDVYADIPIKIGSHIPLAIQRKALRTKPGYKYCRYCDKYKKAKEFTRPYMCKSCWRNIRLTIRHGIGNNGYDSLFKKQKGRCALCGTKNPSDKRKNFFDVDHNHQTNKIRGLLCNDCNSGAILDKIQKGKIPIARLIKYLKPSKAELRRVLTYVKKEISNV